MWCVLVCRSVQYIDRGAAEEFHTLSRYPNELQKKITLLNYFRSYMSEHLLKVCPSGCGQWVCPVMCCSLRVQAGGKAGERPLEEGVRLPHLRAWFRTRSAIVLHLSNGTIQVCSTTCPVTRGGASVHPPMSVSLDQLLPGPHQGHCLSPDASCELHRRGQGLLYLQTHSH